MLIICKNIRGRRWSLLQCTGQRIRRRAELGPKRIQSELLRQHSLRVSTATIWKVLRAHGRAPLLRRRPPDAVRRYNRPLPGDRIQLDTMKVASGRFQYTAIDDCTRLRVLGLYRARTSANAVHFLGNRMVEEFPFPIQRVQTDRGAEEDKEQHVMKPFGKQGSCFTCDGVTPASPFGFTWRLRFAVRFWIV
jgi:hypothetical protein